MKKISLFIGVVLIMTGCLQSPVKDKKSEKNVTLKEQEVDGVLNETVINKPLPKTFKTVLDDADMVLVPSGKFIYGLNKHERDSILKSLDTPLLDVFKWEFPEQIKYLPSFYIDKFEVTNKQYKAFVEATGHRKPKYWDNRIYNHPSQPIVGIGWGDAEAYARWAGKRLPTEEEWEKAARGTDGRIWPWGGFPDSQKYNGRAGGKMRPSIVGEYPQGASPFGAMDMAGNVYEMTSGDWDIDAKAMRSGSYLNAGAYTRTTFRWATADDDIGAEYLGFRCVADTNIIAKD